MTEQDADDAAGDSDAPESEPTEADESEATLEDIAAEPDGDPESALAGVLGEDLEATLETDDVDAGEDLVERVESADPGTIAVELEALRTRVEALESQLEEREADVEDLESRLARKQADFQNYKKRQQERMEEEKRRATEDLVERLLDVRDNLARALEQDEDADIRSGVESTLRQLDEEFERENVERIEPEPGTETDPQHHEVLMRVESDEAEGTVADLHRPGYEMAGKVIRAAQVTVSEGSSESAEGSEDGGSEA